MKCHYASFRGTFTNAEESTTTLTWVPGPSNPETALQVARLSAHETRMTSLPTGGRSPERNGGGAAARGGCATARQQDVASAARAAGVAVFCGHRYLMGI